MNIRNYTSSVPVETTVARIEAKLAAAGASGITKLYGPDRCVCAMTFSISFDGRSVSVRIPANSEACYQAMLKDHRLRVSRMRSGTEETLRDQSCRTAWRLVQDWIDIQISMIVMKQAEFLEVFMPYVWDGRQTYFQAWKGEQFKALPPVKEAA